MKIGTALVVAACGMATPAAWSQQHKQPRAAFEQFRGDLRPATADYLVYHGVRYPLLQSQLDDTAVIYSNKIGPNFVLNPVTPDWRNSVLEDFSFTPGPASGVGALLTSMDIAIGIEAAPAGGFDLVFEFYDTLTPANSPVNAGPNANNGFFFHINTGVGNWAFNGLGLAALPGGGVTIPDDAANGIAVYARQTGTTNPQTGIRFFYAMGANSPGTGPSIGGSAPGTWSDVNQNGSFDSTDGVIVGTFTAASNIYLAMTGTYTPTSLGACCLVGSCTANQTSSQCNTLGGVWLGTASVCGSCPAPGACCLSAGVCTSTLQALCVGQNGVFGGAGTTCPPVTPCNPQYFLDVGTGSLNVGFTAASASIAMVNQFTVANNLTTINSIDIAFGDITPGSLNGLPVDVYLWSDPNQDGNPADAVVLATASGVVASSGTGTFVSYPIPPTAVGPNGTKFFIGLILTATVTPGGTFYPGLEDVNHIQGRSWFLGNTTGVPIPPSPLTGIAVQNGNWLVRADATGSTSACYANCDASTTLPCLNVIDFGCFLNKFAASDTNANCDGSTTIPVLNVLDFGCFLNKFAAGCSSC